jgi:Flp pilus assembly protein TadG
MPKWHSRFATIVRRLAKEQGGNVLLACAISFPALAFAVGLAVDFTSAEADRVSMQGVADAAALAGATQLAVANPTAAAQRTQALAISQLNQLMGSWTLSINTQIRNSNTAMQVTISGNRPALFHDLFPSNGWDASATATAQAEGVMPLCALGTGSGGGFLGLGASTIVDLTNVSQVTAPNCLIQSNQNIAAENSAQVTAGAVQAVGTATGTISPAPQSGAPAIPDPFASINVSVPTLCTDLNLTILFGSSTLQPGVHCGVIIVANNATLTLAPGVHYFSLATLTLLNQAVLQGTNVALVFDDLSFFTFQDNSDIELQGLTSGPLAGFVIAATHGNTKTFTISTTSARTLLGVVYIPSGLLSITGDSPVAQASAWTVIVAQAIGVSGSADLVLNANYDGSEVPVPVGAGPGGAPQGVRLTN